MDSFPNRRLELAKRRGPLGNKPGSKPGTSGGSARRSPRPKAPGPARGNGPGKGTVQTASYKHPEATTPLRPEVGTQAQFRKKKPPAEYRYDSSLAPALEWDGKNAARDLGQFLIRCIDDAARLPEPHTFPEPRVFRNSRGEAVVTVRSLGDAVEHLKRIEKPFLNWAGKAERLSFEIPTLPLFVHERLSTKAIVETLKAHKRDQQMSLLDLWGDPQHPVADQVLKAYEYQDKWQNRLILGDSMVVMNSLLKYEGLGGQVQMIFMDPPYGVKFGSNFQPFVRKRDVKHNDDEDMTREPEMVKAYRDTWELGLHSYLTYLRDRLLMARDLLTTSGSIFVQISDENLHHVRELMDEVFGHENLAGVILFRKTGGLRTNRLAGVGDYLLWYARDIARLKYHQLFLEKRPGETGATQYKYLLDEHGDLKELSAEDMLRVNATDVVTHDNLTSQGNAVYEYVFRGKPYRQNFKPPPSSMDALAKAGRILALGNTLRYLRKLSDFPYFEINELWEDVGISGFSDAKLYVVQTSPLVLQRCMLMTTDPGDLVLDPTCGSGTTAYVAEQWGRRWVTIDTSRVPLALARQRLLTATFPYYALKDEARGPAGGFVYARKQNKKGEEIGGIVPHVTLKSIANNEPPEEEVLVDRPEVVGGKVTRVTGPFVVEATIPTPVDMDGDGTPDTGAVVAREHGAFVDRMLEVLRRSPVLHLGGNKVVTLKNVRPPARTLSLSAEAVTTNGPNGDQAKTVAVLFGPESGAVSEKAVYEAAREAHAKSYTHLYVIGFAIQPNARKLIDECEQAIGVPATYVQATPDLMMGDLLKNMRSSQIFSVCGLPEIKLRKAEPAEVKRLGADQSDKSGGPWYQVELLGLDVFDPGTMEVDHRSGGDVPCWMLDADYNGLCFKASQVFFPRTAAWDDLKRALRAEYAESVWDHLAGTTSTPFQIGEQGQVAVKVIDDRGNELLVVKSAKEARS